DTAQPAPGAESKEAGPGPLGVLTEPQGPTLTLGIDQAVRAALHLNPTVDDALAAIRRAQAVVAEARSFQLPQLNSNGSLTIQGPIPSFALNQTGQGGQAGQGRTISLGNTFQRNLTFTGVYNPDPFGRLRANTRNFRDKVKVERGTFLVTQNELVYSVQNVY